MLRWVRESGFRIFRDKMGWDSLGWVGLVGEIAHSDGLLYVALIRVRMVWDRLKVPWSSLK